MLAPMRLIVCFVRLLIDVCLLPLLNTTNWSLSLLVVFLLMNEASQHTVIRQSLPVVLVLHIFNHLLLVLGQSFQAQ